MPGELRARISEYNDGYLIDSAIKRRSGEYRALGYTDQEAVDASRRDYAPVECAFFTALCVQRQDIVTLIIKELDSYVRYGLNRPKGGR